MLKVLNFFACCRHRLREVDIKRVIFGIKVCDDGRDGLAILVFWHPSVLNSPTKTGHGQDWNARSQQLVTIVEVVDGKDESPPLRELLKLTIELPVVSDLHFQDPLAMVLTRYHGVVDIERISLKGEEVYPLQMGDLAACIHYVIEGCSLTDPPIERDCRRAQIVTLQILWEVPIGQPQNIPREPLYFIARLITVKRDRFVGELRTIPRHYLHMEGHFPKFSLVLQSKVGVFCQFQRVVDAIDPDRIDLVLLVNEKVKFAHRARLLEQ